MNRGIVILGFMASGKTTVADLLAARLGRPALDLDSFITQCEGRSPAEIIQASGEQSFRETEAKYLSDLIKRPDDYVLALGGGTWTMAENRALIDQGDCRTIWLDVPFKTCWERIESGGECRPLAPDKDTAAQRYDDRRAVYALASVHVDAGGKPLETIVDEIITTLQTAPSS